MRKLITFAITVLGLLACVSSASAQVDSTGVKVNNGAPENVFFTFPTGSGDNVDNIQLGCNENPVNANWVFVYELQPNGFVTTYPFHVTVNCYETYTYNSQHQPISVVVTLVDPITVTTPDHTITISNTTNWSAIRKSSRTGYYWAASGGLAQITVE